MFTQDDNQQVVLPSTDDSNVSSGGVQLNEPKITNEDTINAYEPPQDTIENTQSNIQQPSSQSSETVEDNLAELERIANSLDETLPNSSSDDTVTDSSMKPLREVFSADDTASDSIVNQPDQVNMQPSYFQNNNDSNGQISTTKDSEALADQNIFFLLGAERSSPQEQEEFLNELQATIWEDFVQNDMGLLLTSQEKEKADEISNNSSLTELQKQEQLLDYLDTLIPDLEAIMLEKALELKQDLVKERVESLKEASVENPVKHSQVQEVESLLSQGRWRSAGTLLNQIDQ